jgi:hypothetical protein
MLLDRLYFSQPLTGAIFAHTYKGTQVTSPYSSFPSHHQYWLAKIGQGANSFLSVLVRFANVDVYRERGIGVYGAEYFVLMVNAPFDIFARAEELKAKSSRACQFALAIPLQARIGREFLQKSFPPGPEMRVNWHQSLSFVASLLVFPCALNARVELMFFKNSQSC